MAHNLSVAVNLGAGNTGLTLTAGLLNPDGSVNSGLTTADLLELAAGTGIYGWTGSVPDGFNGYVTFSASGVVKAAASLNPAESENADVRTSSIMATVGAGVAGDVWTYAQRTLTQSAAALPAALQGPNILARRGDTLSLSLTGLGSLVGRSQLWFTVKVSQEEPDSAALIQIEESGGLVVLNGAPATSGNGSLVVTNATTGSMTITLAAASTATFPALNASYDVQIEGGGTVQTLAAGQFTVSPDITRATS